MQKSIPGFSSPQVGLDQPLEMLVACHDRVENRSAILQRLLVYLEKNGSDEQAQSAAKNILLYFDTSAKHHHEDEEQDLFPALLKAIKERGNTQEQKEISSIISGLLADHQELNQLWLSIRPALVLISEGESAKLDSLSIKSLTSIYKNHIQTEESIIFPMAKKYLSSENLEIISLQMTKRRSR